MSGPKGATYVLTPAERARQALAAARVRLAAAQQRVAAAEALVLDAAPPPRSPRHSAAEDAAAVDAQVEELLGHAERLEAIHHQRRQDALVARMTREVTDLTITLPAGPAPGMRRARATAPAEPARPAGADKIAALAQRVAALHNAQALDLLNRLGLAADLARGTDRVRAAQALDSVAAEVTRAERAEAGRHALDRQRAACLVSFADVPVAEADAWRALAEADSEVALARARAGLEQARERAQRVARQQFVLQQTEDAFRALGYRTEVAPGDGSDTLVAHKPGWDRHGLRLLFPVGQDAFSSIPEAYGASAAQDDEAFETESCRDIQAVFDRLATRGVDVLTHLALEPGQQPVRRVAAPRTIRRTTAAAAKELSL